MATRNLILVFVLIASLTLAGCSSALATQTPAITSGKAPSTSPAVGTSAATPISHPTGAVFAPTTGLTRNPAEGLKTANLTLNDLPAGFKPMEENQQAQLGLTEPRFTAAFQSAFGGAKPVSSVVFINPTRYLYEMAFSVIFYPISPAQQTSIAQELKDPAAAFTVFSQAFGGRSEIIPDLKPCGQASLGIIASSNMGALTLKGEMVIFLRGNAAVLTTVLYRSGNKPAVNAEALCSLLDQRVSAALP